MTRRKNVKRIDPRYFLHETVNRNDDGSPLEEVEEVSESFASKHGAEASFFADEPGEWGADKVEDQPELDFIFSAADSDVKDQFMLAAADALQAYDQAARKGDDQRAEKLLDQIKKAWLKTYKMSKR